MELVFKNKTLQDVADMLKAAGMDIYIGNWRTDFGKPSYFHFVEGNNIGYCQYDDLCGIKFSTVHKPTKGIGTGFGCQDMYEVISSITVEEARRAFMFAPHWARHSEVAAVKKYSGWDEYSKYRQGPISYTKY